MPTIIASFSFKKNTAVLDTREYKQFLESKSIFSQTMKTLMYHVNQTYRHVNPPELSTHLAVHLQGDLGGNGHDCLLLAESPGHHTLTRGRAICAQVFFNSIIFVFPITRQQTNNLKPKECSRYGESAEVQGREREPHLPPGRKRQRPPVELTCSTFTAACCSPHSPWDRCRHKKGGHVKLLTHN